MLNRLAESLGCVRWHPLGKGRQYLQPDFGRAQEHSAEARIGDNQHSHWLGRSDGRSTRPVGNERYLTEELFKKPVIVTDYPKEIKAFYMRSNDDGKTVAAMDVLAPGIGEIIGGSQREERLDVLDRRLDEMGLDKKVYWWYRDLRRYGTVPHAGFGLGFERTVAYVTGLGNVRDVIPFPRTPGNARY